MKSYTMYISIICALTVSLSLIRCGDPSDDTIVNTLPIYLTPDCPHLIDEELRECALQQLLEDIYAELKYPPEALENQIEGDVTVRFMISKAGTTSDHEITADLGFGCDEEAIRVISLLEFIPAKNEDDNIINSSMTLFVRFRL